MKTLMLLIALLIAAPAAGQQVYKWQDEKGTWSFSHQPPDLVNKVTGPSPEALRLGDLELLESVTVGNILIESTAFRFEGGRYLYLDGVVRNTGKGTAKFIKIDARVRAQGGPLLLVENTYVSPHDLRENQTASFTLMMADVAMRAYEIELVPDWRGRLSQRHVIVRNPYVLR